tara:strand:+ start:630 stop:905 length:276 start_codon:yes stop_codon:yes gene_type:complete
MSIKLAFCILCCSEEEKETKPNQPITKFNGVDGKQNLDMKGISTPSINKIRDVEDDIIVVNPMNNSNANDRGSASDDSSGGFESVDITSIE